MLFKRQLLLTIDKENTRGCGFGSRAHCPSENRNPTVRMRHGPQVQKARFPAKWMSYL